MFSHVCVGVGDTARAYDFYAPLFAKLGLRVKFRDPDGNKLCVVCHRPA